MKLFKKSIWLTFVILILFSSLGFSQKSESNDSLKNELINAAREIMISANTCALITIDKEGNSKSRYHKSAPGYKAGLTTEVPLFQHFSIIGSVSYRHLRFEFQKRYLGYGKKIVPDWSGIAFSIGAAVNI